jgi:hypothetical protein
MFDVARPKQRRELASAGCYGRPTGQGCRRVCQEPRQARWIEGIVSEPDTALAARSDKAGLIGPCPGQIPPPGHASRDLDIISRLCPRPSRAACGRMRLARGTWGGRGWDREPTSQRMTRPPPKGGSRLLVLCSEAEAAAVTALARCFAEMFSSMLASASPAGERRR